MDLREVGVELRPVLGDTEWASWVNSSSHMRFLQSFAVSLLRSS